MMLPTPGTAVGSATRTLRVSPLNDTWHPTNPSILGPTHHPNFARTRGGELDRGADGEPEPDAAVVVLDGGGIGCRGT